MSTRTTRSAATVISHGVLRLLISDICDLIRTRRSLHRAEVVSTECYCRRRGAIFHRFLILELRRAGRKDLWLRIDRRRDRYHPKLQFLTTLSTPANDLVCTKLPITRLGQTFNSHTHSHRLEWPLVGKPYSVIATRWRTAKCSRETPNCLSSKLCAGR